MDDSNYTTIKFRAGKISMEIPEEIREAMIINILQSYRDILQESLQFDLDAASKTGSMEQYQVENIKMNTTYHNAFDTVLDWLGE